MQHEISSNNLIYPVPSWWGVGARLGLNHRSSRTSSPPFSLYRLTILSPPKPPDMSAPTHMSYVTFTSPIFIGGATYSFLRPINPPRARPGGEGGAGQHLYTKAYSFNPFPSSLLPSSPNPGSSGGARTSLFLSCPLKTVFIH